MTLQNRLSNLVHTKHLLRPMIATLNKIDRITMISNVSSYYFLLRLKFN